MTMELLCTCICLLVALTGRVCGNEYGSKGADVVFTVEGEDAILPCSLSTKENIVQKLFDWKKDGQKEVFMYDAGIHYNNGRQDGQDEEFKGRVSHFPEQLKFGNASIIIRKTKMSDSGDYSCAFPRLQPGSIFSIKLVIKPVLKDRSGEISVVSSKPVITEIEITNSRVLLQCDVRDASPQPKLQWQDSSGDVLPAEEPEVSERGGSYNLSLRITLSSITTNRLHCVLNQEEINHMIDAEITVTDKRVEDKSDYSAILLIGVWFTGVLSAAAALAVFNGIKYIKKHYSKGCPQQMNTSTSASEVPLNP